MKKLIFSLLLGIIGLTVQAQDYLIASRYMISTTINRKNEVKEVLFDGEYKNGFYINLNDSTLTWYDMEHRTEQEFIISTIRVDEQNRYRLSVKTDKKEYQVVLDFQEEVIFFRRKKESMIFEINGQLGDKET